LLLLALPIQWILRFRLEKGTVYTLFLPHHTNTWFEDQISKGEDISCGLFERSEWQRAGKHCQKVHEHKVEQPQLDLQQAQADEINVKKPINAEKYSFLIEKNQV